MAVFAFVKSVVPALAAGAVALAAGSAQADVVYQGAWDPAYGPEFPTMGWRAFADLVLSDACATATAGFTGRLTGDPTEYTSTAAEYSECLDTGPNTGARLTDVRMQFYGLSTPGQPSTDFYEGANYILRSDEACNGGTACLEYIDFLNGTVVGLQTSFSDTLDEIMTTNNYLSNGIPDPFCGNDPVTGEPSSSFSWRLSLGVAGDSTSGLRGDQFGECANTASINQPDTVVFVRVPERVPEPGSVPLVLGALGALAAVTRLRRGARSGR